MAYLTHAEVIAAMGAAAVVTFFDDDNDGVADNAVLDAVIARASALTDAWISPVYSGPFPITQTPVPAMIRELTLSYVSTLAHDRRPGYTRAIADAGEDAAARWTRADAMGERLQKTILRITELPAAGTTKTHVRAGGTALESGETSRVFDDMGRFGTSE